MTTDQFRARVAAYVLCGVSPARAMVMARRDANAQKAFVMRKAFES
jgi:hypothetical protein